MHGLMNRAIQCFAIDTYGPDCWKDATKRANLGYADFEAMLVYDDDVTDQILNALAHVLDKSREEILEDIGTYLVSNPTVEALRRLMRFGGVDFLEFLYSLDDLRDRARLAVSDLNLPSLELVDVGPNEYKLICSSSNLGFGHVFLGVLRAMADDYGALVFMEYKGGPPEAEEISITLVEEAFAEGRSFELGAAL